MLKDLCLQSELSFPVGAGGAQFVASGRGLLWSVFLRGGRSVLGFSLTLYALRAWYRGAGCLPPTPRVGARCHHLLRSPARPEVLPGDSGQQVGSQWAGICPPVLPSCLVANQRPRSVLLLGQSGDVIVAGRFPRIRPMRRGRSGIPCTVLAQYPPSPRGPGCRRGANGRQAEARGGVASPSANGV